jgi:hypothetical protein
MNKLYRSLGILAALTLFISACSVRATQAQPKEHKAPRGALYKDVLGKSLSDKTVSDFMTDNHCSSSAQFQLCKDVGVALLIASNQIVETVYLYLNNVEGFAPYKGELPHGLKYYDIMGAVEYKLKRRGVGNAGLPDEGSSPDHLHYWATYKQVGMTIIYNSPSPEDEDATIYAILVSK